MTFNILNGFKIKFGGFIGSTYAFNQIKEKFDAEFNQSLKMNEYDGNLCIVIEDEEKVSENDLRNMYYFIKGYCMAHKNINFSPSHLFK